MHNIRITGTCEVGMVLVVQIVVCIDSSQAWQSSATALISALYVHDSNMSLSSVLQVMADCAVTAFAVLHPGERPQPNPRRGLVSPPGLRRESSPSFAPRSSCLDHQARHLPMSGCLLFAPPPRSPYMLSAECRWA
jgi:hypothetical protein